MRASLISLVAVVGWAGCASAGPQRPTEVVDQWRRAAAAQDAAGARRLSVAGSGLWPDGGPAPAESSVSVPSVETGREARWRLGRNGTLVVAGALEEPLIASGVLGLTRASDPVEAVQLFVRGWRERDFNLLLSLLPSEERAAWTAESLARALKASPHAERLSALAVAAREGPLEPTWLETGASALVEVGPLALRVVAEDDGWKVADLRFTLDPPLVP